ncbi:HEPN domain-containing protein [Puia dinghuensis]|uniref:HEPN domain-containing protein n=1 Tax=Puia dinghuensis TaxID=1792502 RepID=A0A8J2UAW0_9BACT|nr:HEPN domain-containing protein [Puia dinghuensis]GGA90078.1 hypothetical protein GCM10011511_11640 [Puia dinghuensis]
METRLLNGGEFLEITQKIINAVQPEFIICYGCRTIERKSWGAFLDNGSSTHSVQTTYDLLVIPPQDCKYQDHEVVQKVEQQSARHFQLNCLVHKIGYVNEAIKAGSRFYYSTLKYGLTLYESGRELLLPFPTPPDLSSVDDWNGWFDRAQRCFSLAGDALSRKYYEQTLFLLHQTTEFACIALLRFFTGYHSATHNLTRLLAMTESISLVPRSVFPGTTKEETELLTVLSKAYSDSRYKESYTANPEKVDIIMERVKAFMEVAVTLHIKGPHALDEPTTMYGYMQRASQHDR